MTGLSPVLLLGCSTVQMTSSPAYAQSATSAGGSFQFSSADSQLMFEIMIAELAGRRGQLDVAMTGYLRAAERTDDPRVSERATRLAIFGRQWPEAELAARRWRLLEADSPEANKFLAESLIRQNKIDDAADEYVSIVNSAEDKNLALRKIQTNISSTVEPQDIKTILTRLELAFPMQVESHLGLARVHAAAGEQEAALDSARMAIALDPENDHAVLLAGETLIQLDRATEGLETVKESLSRSSDNHTLRSGYARLLVRAGRHDEVGSELDILFKANPDDPDGLLNLSSLALDSRRLDRARVYLSRLLETGKYTDRANYYLALIEDQQQDYISAIEFYDAVDEGDLLIRAQIRVAELLGQIGEVETGRERLRDLATMHANPELQPQLLTAESRLLQAADRAPEAVEVLSGGLVRFPNNGELLYARALAADVAGDPLMLVGDLNTLIELQPDNAHALNALGYHLTDNNVELERAEILLNKAIALLPDDPAIMDSLGWLYYRQGKMDAAITLLTDAYELLPDSEIAAHLGQALLSIGREEEAAELIENALIEDPEDSKLLSVQKIYSE